MPSGPVSQSNQVIKEFDRKIKELFKSHPDHFLFENLPGAGEQLAPRLLSLFGSNRLRSANTTDIQKYSGVAPVIERSGKSIWVHRRLSRPKFMAKPSMSLPSKAFNVLRGRISIIGVNARKVGPITVRSAPWPSSGYASFSPAGRPTSLTMNLSIFRPLQKRILPFPRLDGSPQTLEGGRQLFSLRFAIALCAREKAPVPIAVSEGAPVAQLQAEGFLCLE